MVAAVAVSGNSRQAARSRSPPDRRRRHGSGHLADGDTGAGATGWGQQAYGPAATRTGAGGVADVPPSSEVGEGEGGCARGGICEIMYVRGYG